MSPFQTTLRARNLGLSLLELMVAMSLSLLLLGGVAAIFVSSKSTYESNDRLARIEENGRFALAQITRDLRASGYVGCAKSAAVTSTLNNAGTGMWQFDFPVQGYNATGTAWEPALGDEIVGTASGALATSDVLLVRVPVPGTLALRLTSPMATSTDVLNVPKFPTGEAGAFKNGQILMISSCRHRSYFQISTYDPQAGTIAHEKAGTSNPGNSTNDLGDVYQTGASAIGLRSVTYFVKNNAQSVPSLYRRDGSGTVEELVEGVEMIQLRFTQDTNGNRVADLEANAKGVSDFSRVVSVSVGLLVRSIEPYGAAESRDYQVLDTTVTKNDRYMRKVFSTTAAIRNSAL